jgi:hypothetical protein
VIDTSVEDLTTKSGNIYSVWDGGRKGDELATHFEWLRNGMNYWDELRGVLRRLYIAREQGSSDFSKSNWAYEQAYLLGYQRALQEVHKILPRPKE